MTLKELIRQVAESDSVPSTETVDEIIEEYKKFAVYADYDDFTGAYTPHTPSTANTINRMAKFIEHFDGMKHRDFAFGDDGSIGLVIKNDTYEMLYIDILNNDIGAIHISVRNGYDREEWVIEVPYPSYAN